MIARFMSFYKPGVTIPLLKAVLTMVQRSLSSSSPKGTSKFRGASAPPATAGVGSASAGPQAEKEVAQGLGQLREEGQIRATPERRVNVLIICSDFCLNFLSQSYAEHLIY